MKTIDVGAAKDSLAEYTERMRDEAIIVTRKGKPVAALLPLDNTDLETASLSTSPKFMALIERARQEHREGKGVYSEDVRRELGLKPKKK